jgi:hypothetical protein
MMQARMFLCTTTAMHLHGETVTTAAAAAPAAAPAAALLL